MSSEKPERKTLLDLPAPDPETVRKLLALLTPPTQIETEDTAEQSAA